MRKLLIAVLVVVLLVVGIVVLAVVNVNALLEENRGELTRLASDAAGRDVTFERAEVAFPGRLSIEVRGLRVSEDPRFGQGDFLSLESAYVDVELWPALQRRIEVAGIRLDRPTIRIVQTTQGFNFASLGATEPAAGAPPSSGSPNPPGSGEPGTGDGSTSPPIALAIAGFQIEGATILYEDRTSKPPVALTLEDFDSSGTDIIGAAAGEPIVIHFSGLARPTAAKPGTDAAKLASRLEGVVRVTDLEAGALDLQLESPSLHPLLLGFDFEEGDAVEHLDGFDVTVSVPANAATAGYPIHVVSSGGRLAGFDYKSLDTKILFRTPKVDIENLALGIVGGQVGLAGTLTLGPPNRSPFHFDTRLSDLDADALAVILLGTKPGILSGRVGAKIDLAGDSLDWEVLKRSLAGKIDLSVREGALEQVNLLDRLVERLLLDPGLGQLAANAIREAAPEALAGDRTAFENIELDLAVAKGTIKADALQLKSGDFALLGTGTLGLDGSVDGTGRVRLSDGLSAKILKKAGAAGPLLGGADKVVELPIAFGGTTAAMTLQPDLAALAARARANATDEVLQDTARKLTDALLGKKKKAPTEGQEETQADRDRAATEDMLNRGLNSLFKKK
jgi:uncharacterized protein involved in outer membrane biogenesis